MQSLLRSDEWREIWDVIKVDQASLFLKEALDDVRPSAARILSSFGKDSLATIELCSNFGINHVLYIQDLDEVYDKKFIESIVGRYNLTVTRVALGRAIFLPLRKQPLFLSFPFLNRQHTTVVPTSMERWEGSGPYVCLDEELRTTRGIATPIDTDLIITGFKLFDMQKGTCPVPQDLLSDDAKQDRFAAAEQRGPRFDIAAGLPAVAPLFWWTDDEVWDYLAANNVPVSDRVYDGRVRRPTAQPWCTRCHDPRESSKVWCPKVQTEILNTAALANPVAARLEELRQLGVLTAGEATALLEEDY